MRLVARHKTLIPISNVQAGVNLAHLTADQISVGSREGNYCPVLSTDEVSLQENLKQAGESREGKKEQLKVSKSAIRKF